MHYISDFVYLSKFIEGPVIFLDVVLFQPLNGLCVVHPSEGPLGWLEILKKFSSLSYTTTHT